jgi:hypothetical protein
MTGTGPTRPAPCGERSGRAGAGGKETTDRRPANHARRAQDAKGAPQPAASTWARAELREQIQRAGAALGAAAQPANRQTRQTDRSPLADREAEP